MSAGLSCSSGGMSPTTEPGRLRVPVTMISGSSETLGSCWGAGADAALGAALGAGAACWAAAIAGRLPNAIRVTPRLRIVIPIQ